MKKLIFIFSVFTKICCADVEDILKEIQNIINDKELMYEQMQIDPNTVDDMPYFYWYRGTIDGLQLAIDIIESEK